MKKIYNLTKEEQNKMVELQPLYELAKKGSLEVIRFFEEKYNMKIYTYAELNTLQNALNEIRRVIDKDGKNDKIVKSL